MTIIPLFKDLFVSTVAYSDKGLYWPCAEKTATHVLQGLDKINMILPKACNNVVPGGILLFLHAENNSLIFSNWMTIWIFKNLDPSPRHHGVTNIFVLKMLPEACLQSFICLMLPGCCRDVYLYL